MTEATALHHPIAGANESRDRRDYPRFRISGHFPCKVMEQV